LIHDFCSHKHIHDAHVGCSHKIGESKKYSSLHEMKLEAVISLST